MAAFLEINKMPVTQRVKLLPELLGAARGFLNGERNPYLDRAAKMLASPLDKAAYGELGVLAEQLLSFASTLHGRNPAGFDAVCNLGQVLDGLSREAYYSFAKYWMVQARSLSVEIPPSQALTSSVSRRIFVVHGHDDAMKEQVARVLERLRFEVVILHEQPNLGLTLTEKLLRNTKVGYAVVLLSPDDQCSVNPGGTELEHRARQNVIFELGLFVGRLGPERVFTLVKGDVVRPSDWHGVVYETFDQAGAWKLALCRELAQFYELDMNRLTTK